jgi:general secretion pathway protein D
MGLESEGTVEAVKRREGATAGRCIVTLLALTMATSLQPSPLGAQDTSSVRVRGDSLSVRFVDVDLRAVIQTLSAYLAKPLLAGPIPQVKVSVQSPVPIPRSGVPQLLKGLVEAQNLDFLEDSAFYRVAPRDANAAGRRTGGTGGGAGQGAGGPVQLFVIRLKHAHAADVAATVNQLFGGAGEFAGRSGLSSGTLSDELRRNAAFPTQPSAAIGPAIGAAPSAATARQATLQGPVTIVSDQLTNSLLIRASADDYATIQQAVDQLDIRPLQVLIEVLIVEARRDRSFSLGADLKLPTQSLGDGATIEGASLGGGIGDLVLHIMNLGPFNIEGTLRAAQSKGDVKIVSRPVLLASNNTEAHFLVGSQRPFVQVSRSLPTETAQRDQVVQYKDVGTKLTVLPTINQDGYVSLLIQQEVSAATTETQFDAPVISTREAGTRVLVRDGQTIVLGGMRDEQKDDTHTGIPLLSGLPIIGGLFGASDHRTTETELFLFITPRILKTDDDAARATQAAQDSAARAGVPVRGKE